MQTVPEWPNNHRKYELNINDSNPLFLQKNLSTDKLEMNLRMLLQKCGLTLASSVTMDDLERVILEDDPLISDDVVENVEDETMENDSVEDVADSYSDDEVSSLGPLKWPPAVGDHVTVNFDTGFKIGEITDIKENDKVRITFMHPKPFAQAPRRRF